MVEGLRIVTEEGPAPKLKIEIFPRRAVFGRRWYFRVISTGNGEKVAASEGYHNRADCKATADLLRDNLSLASIFGAVK
jgi:uncharacterized protein YegP (UPF0339 family)